jgi:molybdopterin-containing oxidoreductase family membrane subunit
VIIISYGLRSAYDWDHILTDEVFKGLTKWLGLFSLLYIWLQLQQLINGLYAAPLDLRKVTWATVTNAIYVDMVILMTIVLGYIFASSLSDRVFSKRRSLIVSFMALYATMSEKILFVFEGLEYPTFSLYHAVPGHYTPSIVELASIAGTVSACTLLFLIILKLFPVIELHAVEDHDDHGDHDDEEVSA